MEPLNPEHQTQSVLKQITTGIMTGIANQKIKGLSSLLQITDAMKALDELTKFVPEFIENFNKQQQQVNTETKNVVTDTTTQIKTKEEKETNNDYTLSFDAEKSEMDIDININQNNEEKVKLDKEKKTSEGLRKILATSVSINMCNIIKNKLITPVTHTGIDYGMRKVTAGIDKTFKDKEALAKAHGMIDDLKHGGEAGLPHLGALSDAAGKPIKVLDENGNVIRIVGEDKGGEPVEVQYFKPNENNLSGHWTLPGGKEPEGNYTGQNNCLFDVVGSQIGIDSNVLRENTNIERLEYYKKDALTMGGAKLYNGVVTIDEAELDTIIELVNADGYDTKRKKETPQDYNLINAKDDDGNDVQLAKHHIIPESQIKKDLKKFVNANKGDKKKLLREFNDYLNHPHNSLGKSVFIKHVGLDKTDEVLGSEHLVAGGVLVAASWHPNNLRVGPEGALRSDEPTVIKTEYEIDRAVAGKDTRIEKILDNYVKQKDNNNVINILRTQNQLTNKVDQYGWSKIQNTKSSKPSYRVNDKQNIGKITKLFTRNRDDRRKFNIQTGTFL
ncbi:unnamed protein product [Didymodactylos carnosus]|uniref:Uncharacterized protein n=1 Tax=Didymodactylos carnosus TaxID=1234261 RepID=A0A815ISH3_9BILA|nr:unnamed protein product [Didymodactylos carnosus]CAF4253264.1 unnamed protein product [Didymodactylos carnosus]